MNFKFPLNKCPYCGGRTFKNKTKNKRNRGILRRPENPESEATELHSGLQYKNTGKYAICADCGKRLFKVDDNLNVLE